MSYAKSFQIMQICFLICYENRIISDVLRINYIFGFKKLCKLGESRSRSRLSKQAVIVLVLVLAILIS